MFGILTFFATFRTFCRKPEMLLPKSRVISSVDAAVAAVIAALTAIITRDFRSKFFAYFILAHFCKSVR